MSELHPDTATGAVRLAVADADRVREFYEQTIGLRALEQEDGLVPLGVEGGRPLVELVGTPDAPPRPPGTTGLFHLAILVPSRQELARSLRRVAETRWPLAGASDHLVSEALYLSDPEGNGIEIYRDRPREEWRYAGGELQMATLPLDLDAVLAELRATGEPGEAGRAEGEQPAAMPADTRMGHVHLQVADLAAAEDFYCGALGFEVTVRGYPGALFVSAGGYHHHIGLNTWAGPGAPSPPPGSLGLRSFEVALPSRDELGRVEEQLRAAGVLSESVPEGVRVTDPSGNALLLSAPPQ